MDEGDLKYVAFKVYRLHLAQTKCLEVPGGSLKKARESQSNTGSSLQPGYTVLPKSRKGLTRVPKKPRSEGSTLLKEV
jgi:hypothetical protein